MNQFYRTPCRPTREQLTPGQPILQQPLCPARCHNHPARHRLGRVSPLPAGVLTCGPSVWRGLTRPAPAMTGRPGQRTLEELVRPRAELAQGAYLGDAVAVRRVRSDAGVRGVPVGGGLWVEPVDGPDRAAGRPQQVGALGAVVGAGIAADDDHAVPRQPGCLLLKELAQDRAVVTVAVAADH